MDDTAAVDELHAVAVAGEYRRDVHVVAVDRFDHMQRRGSYAEHAVYVDADGRVSQLDRIGAGERDHDEL
jgi:hypothetical protein